MRKEKSQTEDAASNRNNNESVPLTTIVDELQAEVKKLIANQAGLQSEVRQLKTDNIELADKQDVLQAEIKQLTANQDDLQAEITRLRTANQNANKNNTVNNTNSTIAATASPNIDDDVKRSLFTDSTHQYLFMDTITRSNGISYKVGWNHKFLAFSVIAFQIGAYYLLLVLIIRKIELGDESFKSPTLEIDSEYCYNRTSFDWYDNFAQASITAENLLEFTRCSNDPAESIPTEAIFVSGIVSFFVLSSFLLPDLFELFILLKCNSWREKLVGVLLLFKTVIATVVSLEGIDTAVSDGLLDSILLVVGLIFIHEIDEQFFYMQEVIEHIREKYCRITLQFGIFYFIAYLALAAVRHTPAVAIVATPLYNILFDE